jgi:hypothetical protein
MVGSGVGVPGGIESRKTINGKLTNRSFQLRNRLNPSHVDRVMRRIKSSGHHHSLSLVMRFQLQRFRKLRQTEIAWKGSPRRSRAPGQGEKNARHHWDLHRDGTTSQQNTRGSKRLANSAKR